MAYLKGRKLRIGVFANISCHYLDEIIIGIGEAASSRADWEIRGAGFYFETMDAMLDWGPDAIIATVVESGMEAQFARLGVPVVNVSGSLESCIYPTVRTDDYAVGKLAAEHLLELNLKHFGCWMRYSLSQWQLRQRGFVDTLMRNAVPKSCINTLVARIGSQMSNHEHSVADWLASLPKPVGVLACQDANAQLISRIAARAGISIPDQLAVIGVDNDEKVCKLCHPPMTSIELRGREVGARAVELLTHMLEDCSYDGSRVVLVPPEGLIRRGSTMACELSDDQMALAMRYIRCHAADGISVTDVADEIFMSRRRFECRFKQQFNTTPGVEIRRAQLQFAKRYLQDKKLSIGEVARKSGFCDAEYMAKVFRRELNISPSAYRKTISV